MKQFFLIALVLVVFACQQKSKSPTQQKDIPNVYVVKSKAIKIHELYYVAGSEYSGHLYELYPESTDTLLVESYHLGLRDGVSKKWYEGGVLMESRFYSEGKKDGEQISFWENGLKRFVYTAKNDAYEGALQEWNSEGGLFHLGNFENGREEGAQKLWYDNGKIRANYVIKDGKRYGLLGTKNCVNVSDSIFITK
ncbi:toxin-antitoxin system YwqK family antitoxin [Mariniflexile sp. AS56]|uniref:toxin-antitoxin system YwqK family antitoxin n=1 Tax=Mariniflexile sp. AS56 TaxID=3063957 RepID=UPI0026E9CA0F|nr:toxin-antitoxin system YwqK family antitoxin [Mariniflexile sp. AS56]MDO7174168.1 toxin-antitoxin system YwqK family antitoxin [Mariniflexile sp. AS56]